MHHSPSTMCCALSLALLVVTVAGCTYYQTVPTAPSGPSTFDRS